MTLPKGYTLAQAFALVDKPEGECWIWPGSKNGAGRAIFRGRSAPRVIYEMLFGSIGEHLGVLHSCDNPRCVNPAHLWVGTQKENVRDCWSKGRAAKNSQPPGERHSMAKLTERDAVRILERVLRGEARKALALEYGVGVRQIGRIVTGDRWAHLQEHAVNRV